MNKNFMYEKSRRREISLARVYIPFQIMNQVFNAKEALKKGTLFPELYMPYEYAKKY